MPVCTLEYDSFDTINNIFMPVDGNSNEFCEECLYCFKRIAVGSELYALKCSECSEPETAYICEECYEKYKSAQRMIAMEFLKEFLNGHGLEILEDDSSYSDDSTTSQFDNYFFVDKNSDLLVTAPDYIIVASYIAGCVQVGHRKSSR